MTEETKPSELYVNLEADQLYQDVTGILLLEKEPDKMARASHNFLRHLQGLALDQLMSSAMQSNRPVTPEMLGKETS